MRHVSILLFLLLLLSVGGSVYAAPAVVFENIKHDFGEITQGDKLTYTFRFQNAGDQVLEIGRVRSSCGCTAALLSTRRLSPGTLGELAVTFDSHGFRGRVQKVVTFDTNDPKHPSVSVVLQGVVKAELYITPQRINWGRVKAGTPLRMVIDVVNESDQTISLSPPVVTVSDLSAQLSSMTLDAGEKVSLEVTANFPHGKKRLAGYVILHSDFPAVPELRVPVSARLSTN